MNENHFKYIFWYIVGLTGFGFYLTIYLMIRFKGETAERFADQAMIFWLTSAVGGGIGYLIGSSMNRSPTKTPPPGSTTDTEIVKTETTKETIKSGKDDIELPHRD